MGNAGDLLNRVLIEHEYGATVDNVDDGRGRRLLLIGSVAHRIETGDLVFGVGTKGREIPSPATARCRVIGTRGPITTAAFASAGHDLTDLAFELDPGLLIGSILPNPSPVVRGRVVVVPHYRDGLTPSSIPSGTKLVSIDAHPAKVADEIAQAELVLASSLHGLIFAHALNRPAMLFHPNAEEALLKYEDYALSMGLSWRTPPSLDEAFRTPKPDSPITMPASLANLRLPTWDDLVGAGIASS